MGGPETLPLPECGSMRSGRYFLTYWPPPVNLRRLVYGDFTTIPSIDLDESGPPIFLLFFLFSTFFLPCLVIFYRFACFRALKMVPGVQAKGEAHDGPGDSNQSL